MFKKKIIIIFLIIIIIIIGFFLALKSSKKGPQYSTFTVTRGTLSQSVEATGKVESAESIKLNFKITGRIANIFVKVGDQVTANQTLATLENSALQSQVDDARAQLNQTQADYDKLLAGASAEDIFVSEQTVAQEEQDLMTAQNDLANLKLKRQTELLNLKEAALTILNNEIIVAQGALDEIDNTLNDPDAQETLSIKNSSALTQAENSQENAEDTVNQGEDKINLINIDSPDEQLLNMLDDFKNTLSKVAGALSDVLDVLAATVTSSSLSETELDTLKSNIKSQQTKINTSQTNIQTAKSNWTNKIAYYQDQITVYQDAVKQAQSALDIAIAQLNLKKSPPRQFEVDAAKAKIAQAHATLNLALANLNDTVITAPVKGTITQKNYEKGEQSSLTPPVLEMISESNLQIEVDIPESDIAKVKTGQDVEITLDAFGDEQKFLGKVTFIDPAETVIQDVVYYQVKVQFNQPQTEVKPGMTANVTICTNKKENVLFVPSRAIKSRDGEKYVEVLELGLPVEKDVITGLRGDEGVEIVSGLEEGEEVVTFVKE